ncbi:MAG TPA: hypothetical protein VIG99_12185 [Myxococcaceae bacterium]|jgi:hypothetical protein
MLSPAVNGVVDQLALAYSTITRVDAFAYAALNSTIGKLSPDPDWLGAIRNELALLSGAGAQWQQKKPQIWTPLLNQFHDHATLVSAVANVAKDLGGVRKAAGGRFGATMRAPGCPCSGYLELDSPARTPEVDPK